MPETFDILDRAQNEGWNDAQLAKAMEIEEKDVVTWRKRYQQAVDIINAPNAAESFRRGVRYSIKYAVEEGLETEEDFDQLATQICYMAADLAVLLEIEDKQLSDYSRELRRGKGVKYFGDEEL
jgi:hypothetical protein